MTEKWILQDLEKLIAQRNRVVILDPAEKCRFLLPVIQKEGYIILETNSDNKEEWRRVKEELFLRFEAESKYRDEKVVFYVTRPLGELTLLYDYCFTHGCIDLSNPAEWIRKKLFVLTGIQVNMDNPMLLTAAKLGMGKNLSWWKKILQNLEELISIDEELIPFLSDPEGFMNRFESDVKRLYEVRFFELIGQPYRSISAKSLAKEIVNILFTQLLNNEIKPELLANYYNWLDSKSYSESLRNYISKYKIDSKLNIWNVHPDHCFESIDLMQLRQITKNFRNKSYVSEKLQKLSPRIKSKKASGFVPSWWNDLVTIVAFDNKPLTGCNSLEKVTHFYTSHFYKLDRAIRNIYAVFLHEEDIVRPIQEHYESLNSELMQHWFDVQQEYKSNQQGYLPKLIAGSKPGIAIIVGDGLRYEIAAYVGSRLQDKCKVTAGVMYADMPSETEHNMSALYVGNNEVVTIHKEREKKLSASTGKEIVYLNLEALHYGIKADYLVLTYKDIDSAGEKLQLGAIKLFGEFERVLIDKIELLLNMGYREVHLITDHGFVLTCLLDESDKFDPSFSGQKEVHERFVRTVKREVGKEWIEFEREHGEYNYLYVAKSHKPFKSVGVYGFSHGGFTPQEIIIPSFVFRKEASSTTGLDVVIINKQDLTSVTGEVFAMKIHAPDVSGDLFSSSRKVQVLLYANGIQNITSSIITIEQGKHYTLEFSFGGNSEVTAVLVDATTQEQLDSVKITKTNARDMGGLF